MKIAVVASGNPLDIRVWSGTPYFMTRALQSKFPDLVTIDPPRPSWWPLARRGLAKITGGRVDLYWDKHFGRWQAQKVFERIKQNNADVAVCIAHSPLTAHLAQQFPVIHVSDATVPLMRNYYPEFVKLNRFLSHEAERLDRLAATEAIACLYSTEWAAKSAISDYGAEPSRVRAIPWGCNLNVSNIQQVSYGEHDECRCVFIGKEWERKGGQIAVDATVNLLKRGFNASLDIIGCSPSLAALSPAAREHIRCHGRVDKGSDAGRSLYASIMLNAAFLFLPTRQDCSPMVFAEANAYGIPAITTDTGGVSCIVHDGVNGKLLSQGASPEDYADLIVSTFKERTAYQKLRTSSRDRFEQVLNWQSWADAAFPIINQSAPT